MTRRWSRRAVPVRYRRIGIAACLVMVLALAQACTSPANTCNEPNDCNPCEDPWSPMHPKRWCYPEVPSGCTCP